MTTSINKTLYIANGDTFSTKRNLILYKDHLCKEMVDQVDVGECFLVLSPGVLRDYGGEILWVLGPRKKGCIVLYGEYVSKGDITRIYQQTNNIL